MIKETLRKYIDENSIDIEAFEDDDLEDYNIDLIKYAKIYVKFFDKFTGYFIDCQDKEIVKLIKINSSHYQKIIRPLQSINNEYAFQKYLSTKEIEEYILDNKIEIDYFVGICLDIVKKKKESIIQKIEGILENDDKE